MNNRNRFVPHIYPANARMQELALGALLAGATVKTGLRYKESEFHILANQNIELRFVNENPFAESYSFDAVVTLFLIFFFWLSAKPYFPKCYPEEMRD